jgi:hypothetical protein
MYLCRPAFDWVAGCRGARAIEDPARSFSPLGWYAPSETNLAAPQTHWPAVCRKSLLLDYEPFRTQHWDELTPDQFAVIVRPYYITSRRAQPVDESVATARSSPARRRIFYMA